MKVRYKLSLLLIGLMLVGCLYITQSYALWIITKEQTKENEMEVGCFSIGFSEQSESINLNNTYPMIDSLGLSSDPYTFTITNTCTINNNYVLTLNTINTNTLDVSKIKYALHKSTEAKPEVGSKLSRINTNTENLNVKNLGTSYILDTGVLSGGTKEGEEISGGEEVTYNLYIWIDDIAGNEVEGQTFEASINVINVATESNDQGELFGSEVAKCGANGKDAVTCMKENAYLDPINLAYDGKESLGEELGTDDNNLRYIGANPNNYVLFNEEKWRIIGVMNNITEVSEDESKTETKESHLKIITAKTIGDYVFDENHTNDYSKSTIKDILNSGTYWNDSLKDEAKKFIANISWNIGGSNSIDISANKYYEYERGELTGNDNTNESKWTGKIGLIYPSDFGYATSGTENYSRSMCLAKSAYRLNETDCKDSNYLTPLESQQFTMTSHAGYSNAVMRLVNDGTIWTPGGDLVAYSIKPVLYLKSNIKITNGDGTEENPFVLEA